MQATEVGEVDAGGIAMGWVGVTAMAAGREKGAREEVTTREKVQVTREVKEVATAVVVEVEMEVAMGAVEVAARVGQGEEAVARVGVGEEAATGAVAAERAAVREEAVT